MKAAPAGLPDARGLRVGLLASAFNAEVVAGLVAGARDALREMGASPDDVVLLEVPGAFELPLCARAAAESGRFHGLVALAAVIQGETDHYEHIAREASAGLAVVARETRVPVGFGVLTVRNEEQARARSAEGPGNKGAEAARAAVAMVRLIERIDTRSDRGTRAGARKNKKEGVRRRGPSR